MNENAKPVEKKNPEKKNNKKVVVIETVVIIILVLLLLALGIPMLINYLNSSKLNTDTLLVKNLNAAIEKSGVKHETMQDALDCVEQAGYILERINVSSDENEILWDSDNDLFCYLDAKKNKIVYIPEYKPKTTPSDVAYFKIYQTSEMNVKDGALDLGGANSRFSAYLVQNDSLTNVKTDKGLDSGKNQCIVTVEYTNTNERSVIIRTNGEELVINGPKDVVKHYGTSSRVTVIDVAPNSYHEYGEVTFITVSKGKIELAKSSNVKAIHFEKSGNTDATGADTFNEIDVIIVEGAPIPEFYSRDKVEINEEDGTKVCTITVNGETEVIYLFKQGIYEQIKIAKVDGENLIWVDKSEANDDIKDVAFQIANNYAGRDEDGNIIVVTKTVDGSEVKVEFNEETREFTVTDKNGNAVDEKTTEQTLGDVVEESGDSADNKEKEINASVKVKAYVTGADRAVVHNIWDLRSFFSGKTLGENAMYTPDAWLDKAFVFSGMSDEEYAAVKLLANAKYADGTPVFSVVNQITPEAVEAACVYLEENGSATAAQTIRTMFADKADYLDWKVDWEVSFDRTVDAGTVVLAGAYNAWDDGAWTGFGLPYQLDAGESVKLMETGASIFNNKDGEWSQNYLQILAYVQSFECGFANMHSANAGTTITVKLCIYSPDGAQRIECGSYSYTMGDVSSDNVAFIEK
ncbi:MAG: hypothetical protein IJQ37_05215 [Clostridia bacterium]|nr:hypothetical protein [Clostridia bacterium]